MQLVRPTLGLFALLLIITGCRDDRIIYRDRDLLANLPAGANGFVGYSNPQTKLTVCGNCHVSQQNQWVQTAHAGAFITLASLPTRQALCEGCHTVSSIGNDAAQEGGWPATGDARYHDVQCESCHGPGEPHVRNPDGGTAAAMLAKVNAGKDMNGTCAECHSGFHHPFVDEWAVSGHGRVIAAPAGNPACQSCHEGKAALNAFGVLSEYEERGTAGAIAITCAVCHDPHRARHEGQLRYAISIPDEEQNLCMRCHHKRGGPEMQSPTRGPHSPEGPMLLGEAGWWPPDMPIEPGTRIVGTHGSVANPRLCAGCHVQAYQITDPQSGNATMITKGHMFEAIPCVDAQGRPTREDNCTLQQRSFRTCTQGCHGSEAAARSVMITVRLRIDDLNNELKRLLALVPASEFSATDNRYSTAEGARFNSQLADRPGSVVHNPFLLEALLRASITQLRRDYGVAVSADLDLRPLLTQPPALQ
jgi:predicted CXXCH cytochrome family protein